MHEVWKDVNVEGFSHLYQVSNLGNVRSKERVVEQFSPIKNAKIKATYKSRILKNISHTWGYLRVVLKKQDQRLGFYIHRLVALTFIPNNNPLFDKVNHINCDKKDNRVENLEWCDSKMNAEHAVQNGLVKRGVEHFASKPIYQLTMDGEIVREWISTSVAASEMGFESKNISAALLKKRRSASGFKWEFVNK
jgi:hypothetical protein